ncbi:MAG: hypothetical protein LBV34_24895, partial [Nocardiopsaceae bacterium]|nr:hypothetical protein [Nocardiopsaceae bacterium]
GWARRPARASIRAEGATMVMVMVFRARAAVVWDVHSAEPFAESRAAVLAAAESAWRALPR